MRAIRLYWPAELKPKAVIELDGRAFRHAIKVLRCRVGQELILFDGNNIESRTEVVAIGRRTARLQLLDRSEVDRESPLFTRLVQAVGKGERTDYAIQKAVELGVTEIVPVISQRGNVSLDPQRCLKRFDHWQGIIIAACEQCGRNRLPRLEPITRFEAALAATDPAHTRIMLAPTAAQSASSLRPGRAGITILGGPEGGFTPQEIALCHQRGVVEINLGPRILRTETAGPAMLALVQYLWGDLG